MLPAGESFEFPVFKIKDPEELTEDDPVERRI